MQTGLPGHFYWSKFALWLAQYALLILIILGFDSPFAYLLWSMGGVFVIVTVTPIL